MTFVGPDFLASSFCMQLWPDVGSACVLNVGSVLYAAMSKCLFPTYTICPFLTDAWTFSRKVNVVQCITAFSQDKPGETTCSVLSYSLLLKVLPHIVGDAAAKLLVTHCNMLRTLVLMYTNVPKPKQILTDLPQAWSDIL